MKTSSSRCCCCACDQYISYPSLRLQTALSPLYTLWLLFNPSMHVRSPLLADWGKSLTDIHRLVYNFIHVLPGLYCMSTGATPPQTTTMVVALSTREQRLILVIIHCRSYFHVYVTRERSLVFLLMDDPCLTVTSFTAAVRRAATSGKHDMNIFFSWSAIILRHPLLVWSFFPQ